MLKYIYFGTPELSKLVLENLCNIYTKPVAIVAGLDKKSGRGLTLSPCPTKKYGLENDIPVITPIKLKDIEEELKNYNADVAILFAYGKIIPEWLLELFPHGIINVHPSLLPLYRGSTPIESPILNGDTVTGITIMDMDKELDHGDIYIQEEFVLKNDTSRKDVEQNIVERAPILLKKTLEEIENSTIKKTVQNHELATTTKKIQKEDGELLNTDTDIIKYRKYKAYLGWPGVYFFNDKNIRVKVTLAHFENDTFVIDKVIPENGKEIIYSEYLHHNTL